MKNVFLTLLVAFLFSTSTMADGLKSGDAAPGFKLQNVDGTYVSLDDYKDQKGVVVIFTCNHCPYAIAYEDRIIGIHNKFAERGYPVVAINPNDPEVQPQDSFDLMQLRAEEKQFPFPYLFDEGQKVYPTYGATRTPHVYLLSNTDEGFKVAYIGAIDDNYQEADKVEEKFLENAIIALMEGRTPETSETKAIGCTIKAKKN
ncbi:MAG: thioredoxin family protein [Bacteroidales bacterium]|nr:thioredoxin family protein [Bacteroidales bacterium]